MNFESHSQAGQDRFVWELLGPEWGIFLDIGANHPTEISNTYALEQMGWNGALVENDAHCVELLKAQRKSLVIPGDATKVDWEVVLSGATRMDYLSLDVDVASLAVLQNLMNFGPRFTVLTVETDAYRFGEARRDAMAAMLRSNGCDILCADVCDQGLSFEIWAVDPLAVDMTKAEKFRRSEPTDWKEFFA